MSGSPWLGSFLVVALLSSAGGCKQDVEDLPDIDPVEDPWVDQIESGNEPAPAPELAAEAAAPEPTGAPAPAAPELAAAAQPGELPSDPAFPDPATAEAAKIGAASVPSSGTSSKASSSPQPIADPAAPTPDPTAAPEPAPIVEPTPTPAAAEQAPAKPAEKPAPAPITMADYNGTFRFSGGQAQRQELAEAIEFGANQVNAMIRGVARKRLTKTQIIEDPVTITVTGDQAEFAWGTTGDGMVVTIDGPTTTMKYQGDKYKVRARSKDGKLITTFQAPDAVKTIVYTLSSDRRTLTAHHKLTADLLSEAVTFKVSYTRK